MKIINKTISSAVDSVINFKQSQFGLRLELEMSDNLLPLA